MRLLTLLLSVLSFSPPPPLFPSLRQGSLLIRTLIRTILTKIKAGAVLNMQVEFLVVLLEVDGNLPIIGMNLISFLTFLLFAAQVVLS
jgi:hypothetical protein